MFQFCLLTNLRAVESDIFSSSVKLSPDDKKLSDNEHGLGKRVTFASIKWSQLLGTCSLQYRAKRVTFLPPGIETLVLGIARSLSLVLLNIILKNYEK